MTNIGIEYREGVELKKAVAKAAVGKCYIAILPDGHTAMVKKKDVTKVVNSGNKYEFYLWLSTNYQYVRLRDEWRDLSGKHYTESALHLKYLLSKL
jgi:hypothetical protein